jgi:hypothetical protein
MAMRPVDVPPGNLPDVTECLFDAQDPLAPASTADVAMPVLEPVPSPAATREPARDAIDRRLAVRRPAEQFGQDLRISLPGAAEARPVDVSATGVLTETSHRLCPGRTVDLFVKLNGIRRVLRARVVRSAVHALSPRPLFRAALQFEEPTRLPEFEE